MPKRKVSKLDSVRTQENSAQHAGEYADAIQLELVSFLSAPETQAHARALADVQFPHAANATLLELRQTYSPRQAGALLALIRLRQQAADKFPDAAKLYFTQDALEQATTHEVATYRAAQLDAGAPPGPVLDLGSGIGGDALALATRRYVYAFESDPLRSALLEANAQALGLGEQISVQRLDWLDALQQDRLPAAAAAFWDPPRRAAGRRLMRLARVVPSWEPVRALLARMACVAIKLMPGIDARELPPDIAADARLEFISHAGVCKECVLWLGRQATGEASPVRQATVWSGGGRHSLIASGRQAPVGEVAAGQVLYEPDPAVIRAGPFFELCQHLGAHLFDPQIAYLVAGPETHAVVDSPFVRAFVIDEVHGYSLKALNARLAALEIGNVELKKRGVPFEPESLRPRLRLIPGGRAAVIFFTRLGDRRLMLIGRRLP